MPPSITTDPGTTTVGFPTQTVELIDYLGEPGGWVPVAHLDCDELVRAVNAFDTAKLSYQIGAGVLQPGTAAFADYQPLTAKGKFVRITINTSPANIVWVGYVLNDEVVRDGVKDVSGTNKLVGQVQMLDAVGLEYFLARKQIDSAVVRKSGASPNWVRIQRPLVFNGGPAGVLDATANQRANRSPSTGGAGVYDFADNFDTAALWSAAQIVAHVLEYHTMLDAAGNPAPCPYILNAADALSGFLDGFFPTLASENKTVFDLLNEIARPQLGLVWWAEYSEAISPRVDIRIQSLAASAVSLPAGGSLPGNTNQETLDFDGERDVQHVRVKQVGFRDYHQIVARGARQTSTLTVGVPDQTLAIDWSQATAPDAVGTEAKYKATNDADRLADVYKRVFSYFRIPLDWDGKCGDGATSPRGHAFPELSANGSILGGLTVHTQGLRMLSELRLKLGWNYENPLLPKPNSPTASLAELAEPFAFVQVAEGLSRWQLVENLDAATFPEGSSEPVSSDIGTTFTLRMQSTVPGIRLVPQNGWPHALALNHFVGANATDHPPEVDYQTLRATVSIEADAYCEGKYPTTGLPENTPLNILTLDFGEQYRLDFLPANTVVGLTNGVPITSGPNGVRLRDDRQQLANLARLAWEWYRLDRQSLSVQFRQVRNLFELGMLITAVGEGSTQLAVNTAISAITIDMVRGSTQIETEDDTLDVRALVA